ncbi:SDR family NAD(P)-dependent oxidoreductase [Candidatus Woesebacteria bacterium]|nr:MAG: SDR family NAD(P)-dependent oxidoreductase [Candidatus Woesebacteria bacterium]
MELKEKTILITGSTDGLGKLLAQHFSDKGLRVIIHGKNKEKVHLVKKQINAYDTVVCDFNKPSTVKSAFVKLGELDILINNAGVWLEGNTLEMQHEKIIENINVNLLSHLLVTRTLLPKLVKSKFAQILNVVSVAGIEIPFDYYHTIYTAAKYGMQGFSEGLEKEFDNKNIRVMGFYPGGMNTKLFKKAGMVYKVNEPWMFDIAEAVEAIDFMLTRSPKINIKRMDLINHLQK